MQIKKKNSILKYLNDCSSFHACYCLLIIYECKKARLRKHISFQFIPAIAQKNAHIISVSVASFSICLIIPLIAAKIQFLNFVVHLNKGNSQRTWRGVGSDVILCCRLRSPEFNELLPELEVGNSREKFTHNHVI